MGQDEPPEFDWMVIFTDREELKWWDYLYPIHTRKGFRHCFALGYQPGSYHWIMLDWTSSHLQLWIYHPLQAKAVMSWAKNRPETTIVSYRPKKNKGSVFSFRILYCVEAIKRLLSIRGFFVITPYQLFKKIMGSGGTIIYQDGAKKWFDS